MDPSPHSVLAPSGLLRSDLWIDQPGAGEEIERRRLAGRLSDHEASCLSQLRDQGYCVLRPPFADDLFAALDADVERLWREQPPEVAYAYQGPLRRFSGRDAAYRRPTCRVADLHAWSEAARSLYLDPDLFRFAGAVFGEPAIATQSLYFQWGSQQPLHRDPTHVRMARPAHLLAAWVALEDVTEQSGPLLLVPGSHRLPYYQFAPGEIVHDEVRDGVAGSLRAQQWDRERCAAAGLEPRPFLARRGDVLFWHHSLLHGGSPAADPPPTRKSFVIHYTTRRSMVAVSNAYLDPFLPAADGTPGRRVLTTTRTVGNSGACGFESPLRDAFLEEARQLMAHGGLQLLARVQAMEASRFWKLRNVWFALKRQLHATARQGS